MDKISKALQKLSAKERRAVEIILLKIKKQDFVGLDIKKLKGHGQIFRVRKSDIRIIFIQKEKKIFILAIERRSDNTYY